ncbi:MAG TPA: glycosyltransferase family A protein [Flavobacteriales bacterium]|nr:glycosyltransferase family A protein [Flavobacteriales bacterium]
MRIAVVIPCFNVEHHVDVAVRSIMEQTYDDLDVFAIDDGSTDGTKARLEELERTYAGRFRWTAGPRRGACAARNLGMARTTGEYIQFLDADDAVLTDKLHRQVDLARNTDLPDLVVADFLNVYEDGREEKVVAKEGSPWMALVRTQLGTTSSNLFKRSALEAVSGWKEDQASSQDYELMFRMLKSGARVAWDPFVSSLVLKRAQGSISRTGLRDNWIRFIHLRRAMRDHMERTDPSGFEQEIAAADQVIFMAIRVLARHDPNAGLQAFKENLPAGFVPDPTSATTPLYSACYRLIGFSATDRLARYFSRMRDRNA